MGQGLVLELTSPEIKVIVDSIARDLYIKNGMSDLQCTL